VTGAALDAPRAHTVDPPPGEEADARPAPLASLRSLLRRPVGACVALMLAYGALSLLVPPGGFVAADTGGKVATLHVMSDHGTLDPDVGYWARAWDATGSLHPLRYTAHVGDEWVQVTTLPMLVASVPLYALGGDRLILLFPMLGGLLAALAARALARRVGARTGWTAFWVVGLASPVTIYALSFWEHTLGLAAMAWAMVFLLDVVRARAGIRGACAVGLLFGAAATMRTEALVYFVIAAACMCVALVVRDRRFARAIATGCAAAAGASLALIGEYALEILLVGHGLRGARAASTAADAGASLSGRVQDAATTFVGVSGFADPFDWVVGALVVVLLATGTWCLVRGGQRERLGRVLVGLAALFALLRLGAGLGFVPGLLTAAPFAAVGAFAIWSRSVPRVLAATAWIALPLVWTTQYTDGARPQWGGRYLLLSGLLFTVAAVVVVARHRIAMAVLVAFAVATTAFGFVYLESRTRSVARGAAAMSALLGPQTIVSLDPHLFREQGAWFRAGERRLTAGDPREVARAARVLSDSRTRSFAVVWPEGTPAPRFEGFVPGRDVHAIEVRPDLTVQAAIYHSA
jgi:hypothetical protein